MLNNLPLMHEFVELVRLVPSLACFIWATAQFKKRLIEGGKFNVKLHYLKWLSGVSSVFITFHIAASYITTNEEFVVPATWLIGHILFSVWSYILFFRPRKVPVTATITILTACLAIPVVLICGGQYHSDSVFFGRPLDLIPTVLSLVLLAFTLYRGIFDCFDKAIVSSLFIATCSCWTMSLSHGVFDSIFFVSHFVSSLTFLPYLVWLYSATKQESRYA